MTFSAQVSASVSGLSFSADTPRSSRTGASNCWWNTELLHAPYLPSTPTGVIPSCGECLVCVERWSRVWVSEPEQSSASVSCDLCARQVCFSYPGFKCLLIFRRVGLVRCGAETADLCRISPQLHSFLNTTTIDSVLFSPRSINSGYQGAPAQIEGMRTP